MREAEARDDDDTLSGLIWRGGSRPIFDTSDVGEPRADSLSSFSVVADTIKFARSK